MIAEVSQYVAVASFAEAWIEIVNTDHCDRIFPSPPSRRRGLKLKLVKILGLLYLSPPSRRRGLKYYQGHLQPLKDVASFAEAWIEIIKVTV